MNLELNLDEQKRTSLWMGDLELWMDEQYIQQLWYSLNEKVSVKLIRDKLTGMSAGYAFVDFGSGAIAKMAMKQFNGLSMPNSSKSFKLNWASGGGLIDKREVEEHSIFIGDLCYHVTEDEILSIFQSRYASCVSVKVMVDLKTGMTRGYGFVRFSNPLEQQRALIEMQGYVIGSRPIRVSTATSKQRTSNKQSFAPSINSTTVFIGGLSTPIKEDELRHYFAPFGDIIYVKIPQGKGCGFVQYTTRSSAELAIQQMNGYQIGTSRIRLSWGRSNTLLNNNENNSLMHASYSLLSPSFIDTANNLLITLLSHKKTNNYWNQNQIFAQ
ncbi:hypothetical protein G6F57_006591 [Rhizopus arrhizus]|uniref:RRM domain-containing protein n=1 Tax=Rhizopus oryzae TaxID=64495 RepID=A0A9P6XHF8_RHIOR|nr:hypothetical protein G6F21_006351 [Rhizopus arrhizus]KAG1423679.1 hypothetical protein G6F58_002722 [Rhizopus delemar]KAG0800291.1 hypothetical protein G6F22_002376 [Rhizopus arrhizus]KAG0817063.1 hypothetical protein G6F20_002684 [Rhizopus arrhizus]KAG0830131.1 hypothetical protein G6F19_007372 [Rhizopus arrhizus]